MTQWSDIARETVSAAARTVPSDATFAERKKIIDAAYPFGPRSHWPYKAWLKARKAYLTPFDPKTPAPLFDDPFADLPRDPVTGRPVIA